MTLGVVPTETLCPVCEQTFMQSKRPQGGGKRAIYCSHKCCALDWARGNGKKRKAAVLKYDSNPINKKRKHLRQRLNKYGLNEEAFTSLLERQNYKCGGCNIVLDASTARIDHDHRSGKVRGILCDSCNWALGHAADSRERLYQLAAYLELDRSKPIVYLIGSLRNPEIPRIGNALRDAGYECIDNWFAAGKIADDSWQEYSEIRGHSYVEALGSREANHVFYFDKAYINLSDIVVLVYPAGKSGHLEFGYAVGRGKKGFILLDEKPERFDVMTQFATGIAFSLEELLEDIKTYETETN